MLVLGVDPGTATTGWGIIKINKIKRKIADVKSKNSSLELVDYGCIVTSKDSQMPERLHLLQRELEKLLLRYRPNAICVEQLFFGANARTAMTVGQARGVVMATAASFDIPFFEYQGLVVKLVIGGHGRADKKQVERGVKRILGLRKLAKPAAGFKDDAVDAIAIALCHIIKNQESEIKN